jgi:hypothetical protein
MWTSETITDTTLHIHTLLLSECALFLVLCGQTFHVHSAFENLLMSTLLDLVKIFSV